MRIAIINQHSEQVGGVELYIKRVIPGLVEAGHQVAFLHEFSPSASRAKISEGAEVTLDVEKLGEAQSLRELQRWAPHLVYVHSTRRFDFEAHLLDHFPGVSFLHGFAGVCVSGTKTWKSIPQPCARPLGPGCLAHYFPHHCGGWNPFRMWTYYWQQQTKQALLRRYHYLVTHSEYMRAEFSRHGFNSARVLHLPYFVPPLARERWSRDPAHWRLLFAGRFDELKGGQWIPQAAVKAAAQLGMKIKVTFGGDGPERIRWQREVERAVAGSRAIDFHFTGWLSETALEEQMCQADLLLMPSLWPEPFGQVGLEAGRFGLPVVAFAVGGIPGWLTEGRNGCLSAKMSPEDFAEAIVRALRDEKQYLQLRKGAQERAGEFQIEQHTRHLLGVFEKALLK